MKNAKILQKLSMKNAKREIEKARNILEDYKKSGLKKSTIARVEKGKHSPTTSTLIRMLRPMGYTLKVVPISYKKNK